MHGSSAGTPVPLNSYGGLVTLADASSVPEGASPRTYDTDFLVGEVHSRPGLRSDYAYEGVITAKNGGGSAVGTGGEITTLANATGQLWQLWSRSLENGHHVITWSNFAIPAGNTLPADAVIQGIYAVCVADAHFSASVQILSIAAPGGPVFNQPFFPGSPGASFPSTVFYATHNIGTSLSVLTGATISAGLDNNTFLDNLQDFLQVTACGFVIIYTSATPQVDPQMPLPFALSPGQGAIWAVPTTESDNQNPTGGLVKITSSFVTPIPGSPSTSSAVLFGYDPTTPPKGPLFGPAPLTPIDFLGPSGTVGLGGALNIRYAGVVNITGAATGLPLYPGSPILQPPFTIYVIFSGAHSSPLTTEDALAVTALSIAQFDTGAVQGFPVAEVTSSTTWTNPGNILLDNGSFASTLAGSTSGNLDVTEFAFDLPSTVSVTGEVVTLKGYTNSNAQVHVQLLVGGVPRGTINTVDMPAVNGTVVLGAFNDLWGAALTPADVNRTDFGIRITATSAFPLAVVYLEFAQVQLGLTTANSNFNFLTTFTAQNGDVRNLALDANGNLWVEDLTNNPGFLNLARENITPNSYAVGVNGPDVEYLAFTDGTTGSDLPLQYTPRWIDRITQVGPGAAPVFTPGQASTNTFPILTITQFPPNSDITDPGHISDLLQSQGPGSTAPGNIITVYYSPGFFGGAPHPEAEDQNLVQAFNSGVPVYVYLSGTPFGQGTYLVTSIGNALPPGLDHFRYYFTVQAANTSFENIVEAAGQYQLSVATLTTSAPVPGLQAGNKITITGSSVASYDNTWTITRALNSAAMVITQTSVTASVATYNYSINSGAPPAVGQLVTVTNTTNANGALNVTNAVIQSVSGGASGTFTLAISVVTAPSVPEDGLATTAGTQFQFDPGITTLGTGTSPIFGNATNGTLTFISATAQLIGPGTRQGTVFFITRNGYFTAPAPPVLFTCPENTTSILVSQIPVGPPNVIARGIAITEPGQNGVPGGNFFTIPTPVDYVVQNQTFTSTSFYINDNTSTTVTLNFTDNILLNALAIDVYGYNLFNQIEIGDPGWIVSYSFRNFYGLCWNKIHNFLNLSFDGGYLPTQGQLFPLGWTTPDLYGQLIVSPRFGDAYYIKNTSTATLDVAGLISQSAFEDAYKQPILNADTLYSVRITARIPSGNSFGTLGVSLTANGINYGSFNLPFSSTTASYAIYQGTLLTSPFLTVPSALMLNVFANGLGIGADVEIDRIDIFPTAIPVLGTTVYGSYAGLPEQVDAVTGQVKFESENMQPVNGAKVMYDTLYALKAWQGKTPGASMYSLQASANLEPAQWEEPEVAQKSGSIGVLAYDFGEQWLVMANRAGLYLFEGGQPGKISMEIFQVWEAINWTAANKIWVLNDVDRRRLFVGVPMATPNFWLPNAPVNANPQSPNVILMCNYQGLDSGQMLKTEPQMHTTMFGALNAIDMRRKWSIWQVPSPYAAIVQASTDTEIRICNGRQNSKIYTLDELAETDDGTTIDSLYTTAGLVEMTKRQQSPALGWGRMRWGYMVVNLESQGLIQTRLLPNVLLGPDDSTTGYNAWTLPGGFTPGNPAMNDSEASLNFAATRTYIEFRENDGHRYSLSNLVLHAKKDSWNALRGAK